MAGVTDAPFRKIAREFGAGLACTEMISSEALVRRHRESFRLMDLDWAYRPVPVAGSGDLRTPDDSIRRMRESGVAAVMLGRGILGNLWLVRQTVARLTAAEVIPDLSWMEQIALIRRHGDLVLDYYGAERGPRLLRKFIAWGLRGFRGAARLRTMVQSVASPDDVAEVLDRALAIDPGMRVSDDAFDDGPASCEAA